MHAPWLAVYILRLDQVCSRLLLLVCMDFTLPHPPHPSHPARPTPFTRAAIGPIDLETHFVTLHFAMAEVPGTSSESVGAAQLMKIKIKTMEPATHELEVPASITIAALKRDHIAILVDASADRQRIIYRGRALRDEQTLQGAGRFTRLLGRHSS